MRSGTATWYLIALGAAAAAAWWYFTRASGSSSGYGSVNGSIDTGGWGLPSSAYQPTTSGQQQNAGNGSFLAMLNDSLGLTPNPLGASGRGPLGIRDNNPGNLRYIADPLRAWNGQIGDNQGFGVYDTPADGVRAMSKQLQEDFANGDTTLADLITTWAPPTENDTAAYINAVAGQTGIDPNASLDLYPNLPAIIAAIIQHENGEQPYLMADLTTWAYLS